MHLVELKELSSQEKITKKELMDILKAYASNISVYDLMIACGHMRTDVSLFKPIIVKNSLASTSENFILRMREVISKEGCDHEATLDRSAFDDSFPRFERTFEKEKQTIHKFSARLKENNKDNVDSLRYLHLAEQKP